MLAYAKRVSVSLTVAAEYFHVCPPIESLFEMLQLHRNANGAFGCARRVRALNLHIVHRTAIATLHTIPAHGHAIHREEM